jgi:hypothetical protein
MRAASLFALLLLGCSSGSATSSAASTPASLEVCEAGVFHPAQRLKPSRAFDFVAVRQTVPGKGGGDLTVDQTGSPCIGAVDTACQTQLDRLTLSSGWPVADNPPFVEYVVATIKDDLVVYPTSEDLLKFLGPLDDVRDAALYARSRGMMVDCPRSPHAFATTDGFRLLIRRGACTDALNLRSDGTMTVEPNVFPEEKCMGDGDSGIVLEDPASPPPPPK